MGSAGFRRLADSQKRFAWRRSTVDSWAMLSPLVISRLVRPALAAVLLTLAFLADTATASASPRLSAAAAPTGVEGVPHLGHVFVIIGENTDYDHVTTT